MEEKKSVKEWFGEKKDSFKKFCNEHPDVVLTVIGGFASIVGGCIKLYASKSEFEQNVYVDINDSVYKLPAKKQKPSTAAAKKAVSFFSIVHLAYSVFATLY